MKNKNFYYLFVAFIVLLSSCLRDLDGEEDISSINQTITSRTDKTYNLSDHQKVAELFSKMAMDQIFRDFVLTEINSSETSSTSSVSFMEIVQSPDFSTFCNSFDENNSKSSYGFTDVSDFVSNYVGAYPNLCLSVFYPTDTDQSGNGFSNNVPVFSELIYDNAIQTGEYAMYYDGSKSATKTTFNRPEEVILVIQEREGFTSLDASQLQNEAYMNEFSKVIYCRDLDGKISPNNYNGIMRNRTVDVCGTQITNPFFNRVFITDINIIDIFNENCGVPIYPPTVPPTSPPPSPPSNFLCDDNSPAQRSTWNSKVNEEFSFEIRLPSGETTLDLNNAWCAWWNVNCTFQIECFFSTKFNASEFSYGQVTKLAAYNEGTLQNTSFTTPVGGELFFHPWYFEEGEHGNEWKYQWVGRHRRSGSQTTIGISNSSPKITFKDPTSGAGVEKSIWPSTSLSMTIKNNDVNLGSDLVYWCDDILENLNEGHLYSTGPAGTEFLLREYWFD